MQKSLIQYKSFFLIYLEKARGYSDLTLKTYDEVLNEALPLIEIENNTSVIYLNLMPYRIAISSLNQKTIAKKLSAIRSFSEFLVSQG